MEKDKLNEIIDKAVKKAINEIAGANDRAIIIINELIGKIEQKIETNKPLTNILINSPYGSDMINVEFLDDDDYSKLTKTNSTVGFYNHTTKTIFLRKSRLFLPNWQLAIKTDLLHELTHNIQLTNKSREATRKEERYMTDNTPKSELAKNISYAFNKDEIFARISEYYYLFTETIRNVDVNIVKTKKFKSYVFGKLNIRHSIAVMHQYIEDVKAIDPTVSNLNLLYEIGLAINNKSHDKAINRAKNIQKFFDKYNKISEPLEQIENEKSILKRLFLRIKTNYSEKKKEQLRQSDLIIKEITYMKNMIIKLMFSIYINYFESIKKSYEYILADYINNNGKFSNDFK